MLIRDGLLFFSIYLYLGINILFCEQFSFEIAKEIKICSYGNDFLGNVFFAMSQMVMQ